MNKHNFYDKITLFTHKGLFYEKIFTAGCSSRYDAATVPVSTPSPTLFTTEVPLEYQKDSIIGKEQVSVNYSLKNVSIDGGALTLNLPDFLTESDSLPLNCVFYAGGVISDSGYISCSLEVYKFYQQEDASASLSSLYENDETSVLTQYGSDIEYYVLQPPAYFGDGTGYASAAIKSDSEIYSGVYNAGGAYYKIVFSSYGEKSTHDIALSMLTGVTLSQSEAEKLSSAYQVNLSGGVYTSRSAPIVSVPCPANWQPSESLRFAMPGSLICMATDDGLGTLTVRFYSKADIAAMSSVFIYEERMQQDLISRNLITESDIPNIQTLQREGQRAFTIYPSDIIIIQFKIEDDIGYYCVEMMYSGDDPQIYSQMVEMGEGVIVGSD